MLRLEHRGAGLRVRPVVEACAVRKPPGFERTGDMGYLVMELVEGENARRRSDG